KSMCRGPGSGGTARGFGTARATYRPTAFAGCSGSWNWHERPADTNPRDRGEAHGRTHGAGKPKRGQGAGNSARSLTGERDKTMTHVTATLDRCGGLARSQHGRLERKGFMPLVVEAIGPGPRGLPMVSVAHYYTQEGDAMRDPEMVFEVDAAGNFHPVSFQ